MIDAISLEQISTWHLRANDLGLEFGHATPLPRLRPPGAQVNLHVSLFEGNLVHLDVDAVVNAANELLLRGTGVCEAIFKGAGHFLEQQCKLK